MEALINFYTNALWLHIQQTHRETVLPQSKGWYWEAEACPLTEVSNFYFLSL